MDKDGDLDLVIVRATPSAVVIIPNSGGGVFSKTDWSTYSHNNNSDYGEMAISDFNGDGYQDIAILNKEPSGAFVSEVEIAINNKTSNPVLGYKSSLKSNTDGQLALYLSIVALDVDHDSHQDVVVTELYVQSENGQLSLVGYLQPLLGDGNGNLSIPSYASAQPLSGATASLAVSHIDGDGILDLVASSAFQTVPFENDSIDLVFGNNDPRLLLPRRLKVGISPAYTLIEDMDLDKKRDLIIIGNSSSEPTKCLIIPNQGKRTGGPESAFEPPSAPVYLLGVGPSIGAVADLDKDGRPDLVTASAGSPDDGIPPELRININITPVP